MLRQGDAHVVVLLRLGVVWQHLALVVELVLPLLHMLLHERYCCQHPRCRQDMLLCCSRQQAPRLPWSSNVRA